MNCLYCFISTILSYYKSLYLLFRCVCKWHQRVHNAECCVLENWILVDCTTSGHWLFCLLSAALERTKMFGCVWVWNSDCGQQEIIYLYFVLWWSFTCFMLYIIYNARCVTYSMRIGVVYKFTVPCSNDIILAQSSVHLYAKVAYLDCHAQSPYEPICCETITKTTFCGPA